MKSWNEERLKADWIITNICDQFLSRHFYDSADYENTGGSKGALKDTYGGHAEQTQTTSDCKCLGIHHEVNKRPIFSDTQYGLQKWFNLNKKFLSALLLIRFCQ